MKLFYWQVEFKYPKVINEKGAKCGHMLRFEIWKPVQWIHSAQLFRTSMAQFAIREFVMLLAQSAVFFEIMSNKLLNIELQILLL